MIEAEGARLLRDQRVREDPAGACDEEASRTPRGKRVPAAEINLLDLHGTAVVSVNAHYKTGHFVDWSGRHETPAGSACRGRPRRSLRRGGFP
ncbi:hypothetical protein P4T90_11805, partial [Heyndrickxia acidicola]|nr:hypothetical protein [Heyndrickxia acidicola]